MPEQLTSVVISADRMNKTLDALSVLSLGSLDPARTQVEVKDEDEFSLLEHTFNNLSVELNAMRVEKERSREIIEAQQQAIRGLVGPISELLKLVGLEVVQRPGGTR